MKASRTRLEFALRAAERGWPVIPLHWVKNGKCSCGAQDCPNTGKHPLTEHGVNDATTDEKKFANGGAKTPKRISASRWAMTFLCWTLTLAMGAMGPCNRCKKNMVHSQMARESARAAAVNIFTSGCHRESR